MIRNLLVVFGGVLLGFLLGYLVVLSFFPPKNKVSLEALFLKKQVIGFLPFWLISQAKSDYTKYITTLTYFGLTLDTDGTILKLANPQEEEPGWRALKTGKLDSFFKDAKKNNITLSLLVFSANEASISAMLKNPTQSARNLVDEVTPIMKKYGFSDLNLDIESIKEASAEARLNFTEFVKTVKQEMDTKKAGTLTVEISPTDLIKKDLIDPESIAPFSDFIVVMGYDYHFIGSYVTGPVAPLSGVGEEAEYDIETAIQKALVVIPAKKIILGVPLYGYAWETIINTPRAATIPSSGLTASSLRMQKFLMSCATCSAQIDEKAKESYVIYKDQETGTYHQAFFPDKNAMRVKKAFVRNNYLGGLALWALGYEDKSILEPLSTY